MRARATVRQRTVTAFGYRMRFHWSDPSFEPAIEQTILPGWQQDLGARPDAAFWVSKNEGRVLVRCTGNHHSFTTTPEGLAYDLRRIVHLQLASHAPEHVFVHSGAVLSEHGLVLLPGRSFSGKSTLVRALIALGCRYYSDEYAVVDRAGQVLPFPRPLYERRGGRPPRVHPPEQLGWSKDLKPEPPRAVVCARYQEDGNWNPVILTGAQAVLELLSNTVSARIQPGRAMSFLAQVARCPLRLKGVRGEAQTAALAVLQACANCR